MADETDHDGDRKLYEAIVRAIQELHDRELVRIDTSGPRVTVTVDIYMEEDGRRTLQERAVYAVHEEPDVDLFDDSNPISEEEHLHWSYIGSVEDDAEGGEGGEVNGDRSTSE